MEEPRMEVDSENFEDKFKYKRCLRDLQKPMSGIEEKPECYEYTYEQGEENISDEVESEEHTHKSMAEYNFDANA